ncbi:unnamed protein product, partial [Meganyctiphanes norvegica]
MISHHRGAWDTLGDPIATNIMTHGLQLYFHSLPPLSVVPPPQTLPSKCNLPAIRLLLPDLLSRGIIRKITTPQPLFFSRLFVVINKDKSFRPILDLSILNKLLVIPSFKMETVSKISVGIVDSLWGCTLDLTSAYFHVPMGWTFQKFLAFVVD